MVALIHRDALRREIDAQLDAFESGLGCAPADVDGHQHAHQLPRCRDGLLAALRDRYRGALPWLRSTRAVRGAGWTSPKALLIEPLGDGPLMALADRRLPTGLGLARPRPARGAPAVRVRAVKVSMRLEGALATAVRAPLAAAPGPRGPAPDRIVRLGCGPRGPRSRRRSVEPVVA